MATINSYLEMNIDFRLALNFDDVKLKVIDSTHVQASSDQFLANAYGNFNYFGSVVYGGTVNSCDFYYSSGGKFFEITGMSLNLLNMINFDEEMLIQFMFSSNDTFNGSPYGDIWSGLGGDDVINGNDGNDTLDGGLGNDTLIGGNGDDTVIYTGISADYSITSNSDGSRTVKDSVTGRDGTDTVMSTEHLKFSDTVVNITAPADGQIFIGTTGEDALIGGLGNDTFDGGDGVDAIILTGLPSQYNLNGNVLSGIEGTDTVANIEHYRFGKLYVSNLDASALVDPDGAGPADSPAKDMLQGISDLYVAYFNRAPDVEGLMYWFREVMNGSSWTLPTIAQSFTDQEEYRATYPEGLSNRDFINAIYQNLFDRAPDAAGLDWWEKDLDRGVPRDVFIYAVIQGAYAPTGGATDKALLNNKHDVSLYYSEQLATHAEAFDNNIDKILNRVTADTHTVATAMAVIDYVIENPITLTGLINDTPTAWEAYWT